MRASSLSYNTIAVNREIDSAYDAVLEVRDNLTNIAKVAGLDIDTILADLQDAKDFTGIKVAVGAVASWDSATKTITVPTVKGDTGAKGANGVDGVQGPSGETGPRGIQGIQGNKGDKGDKGDVGPEGQKGLTGNTGPKGDTGLGVHHNRATSTTNHEGNFSISGETDTYTIYGDADETVVLGEFSVSNGSSAYTYAVSAGYTGTSTQFYSELATVRIYSEQAQLNANSAATSASAASVSASTSATKATEAAASASTALGYKNDVSTMKLAIETIYDTFDDRFLGTKTTNPLVDNDGNALIDGALFFDTTTNAMKVYDAGTTTWYAMPQIYLNSLLDVQLTSLTTGHILVWNGTKWANGSLSKSSVGLGSVDNTADSAKNVLSATKLATARTIGGVSFDGSDNINLPGVNIAGNQSTSGNSGSATKLATARTINGVAFDGTSNITVSDDTKLPKTNPAITGSVTEQVYNLTGTAINPANGTIQYKTVSANTTFTETLTSGQSVLLRLINASSYTITFPTITWVGAAAPELTANCVIVLWKEQATLYGAFVGSLV